MTSDGDLILRELNTFSLTEPNQFRARLEAVRHKYEHSESLLQQLVSSHHTDMRRAMRLYDTVALHVQQTRANVHTIRSSLVQCCRLLQWRRHELLRLWRDSVQNKHALHLLDRVTHLAGDYPDTIRAAIQAEDYLTAARMLAESRDWLSAELSNVCALNDLSAELDLLCDRLCECLVHHIRVHIYGDVGGRKQRSPLTAAGGEWRVDTDGRALDTLLQCVVLLFWRITHIVDGIRSNVCTDLVRLVNSTVCELSDTAATATADTGVAISARCDQAPQVHKTVLAIIARMKTVIHKHSSLLETLLEKCDHSTLYDLSFVTHTVQQTTVSFVSDLLHVQFVQQSGASSAIDALEPVCLELKDPSHMIMTPLESPESTDHSLCSDINTHNLSTYFVKRATSIRNRGGAKKQLFAFSASSISFNVNAYVEERGIGATAASHADPCISKPRVTGELGFEMPFSRNPMHIVTIYDALVEFCDWLTEYDLITDTRQAPASTQHALRPFLEQLVSGVLLTRMRVEVTLLIDMCAADEWAPARGGWETPPRENGDQTAVPAVLQASQRVIHFCSACARLMSTLPDYTNHILSVVCCALVQYKELVAGMYRHLVLQSGSSTGEYVLSATWAHDPDISRFLRSLSNWHHLQTQQQQSDVVAPDDHNDVLDDVACEMTCQQGASTDRAYLRHKREAEILSTNLESNHILPEQLITDYQRLRQMSLLHSSTHSIATYLSTCMLQSGAASAQSCGASDQVSESSRQTLAQLARDFHEYSDLCLLVLHLEPRVVCFHHLLTLTTHGHFTADTDAARADVEISRLCSDLGAMHSVLTLCGDRGGVGGVSADTLCGVQSPALVLLTRHETRYVFEGLSTLACSLLIGSCPHIEHVDTGLVKRLIRNVLALQHTLCSISSSHETSLDVVRAYYELLLPLDTAAVLASVREKGVQFSRGEYVNLLRLVHRSNDTHHQLHADLETLDEIFAQLADHRTGMNGHR